MEASMSMSDVVTQIAEMKQAGASLRKKEVKQKYPQLMQNALFYFPSWEHAIQSSNP